jgi:hypothetical protein
MCGGKSPKGGAQDARQFAAVHGRTVSEPPERIREPAGQDARRARLPGCVSLVTFFAQAKKVTCSPEASGSCCSKEKERTIAKEEWIPAFAGMTDKEKKTNPSGAPTCAG